jgi:hypothetical protein
MQRNGADPVTAGNQGLAAVYGLVLQQASLLSFVEAFHIMGIAFLLCIGIVFIMRKPRHARSSVVAVE